MNTMLAAREGRQATSPVDTIFTTRSKPTQAEAAPVVAKWEAPKVRLGICINDMREQMGAFTGNVAIYTLNLIERIAMSREAQWRDPNRTRISKWGRREMMHIFNGNFHQTLPGEWDRYETFGRCYTSPDPFRNDDPPWKASFC